MWLHKLSERHFLLLHLLIIGVIRAKSIEVSEVTREDKITEEASPKDQFPIREGAIAASLRPNGDPKSMSSIMEDLPRNDSDVFKPSVHLGEIEQPTVRTNPFNNVQHVKFENSVHPDHAQRERLQDVRQDAYGDVVSSVVVDEATRSSRIKFQDDSVAQTPRVHHLFGDQQTVTESSRSPFDDDEGNIKHVFLGQTSFQNGEQPTEVQDSPTIFGKSIVDHRPTEGTYFDASRSPYVIGYYTVNDQSGYQPMSQEPTYDLTQKPENGILVFQQEESSYTRKRKFPYQFYQPTNKYHTVEFAKEPSHPTTTYPQMRKLSPWKKIIHLIGTFLPLGLLLATLTPKVVRINNTTQPNIILSKLRAVDLPVEHKQARLLDDQSAVCEDRSICELILAGSEPKSNILQNILWNLVNRVSDDVAKKNGLREMFSAVKKKDCATIGCY